MCELEPETFYSAHRSIGSTDRQTPSVFAFHNKSPAHTSIHLNAYRHYIQLTTCYFNTYLIVSICMCMLLIKIKDRKAKSITEITISASLYDAIFVFLKTADCRTHSAEVTYVSEAM